MRELKIWCATAPVASGVSAANYAELLHLSHLYNAPSLKATVLKYRYIADHMDQL
jgi:hypothetical protein